MYMHATAFGVSRSIVWLQSRRDAAVERARGGAGSNATASARRDDAYEYRVGRLKHERIKVRGRGLAREKQGEGRGLAREDRSEGAGLDLFLLVLEV